jgi:cation diffusion facilitator CzcD-associated flavoprotein CzcO
VGVLGASASAFDNATGAPEAGAREVRLFSRRPQLPQTNKSKWAAFPGFFHGLRDLDDNLKWQIYTYLFAVQTPPPHASVLRRDQHAGFVLHFAEPWLDVAPGASADGDPEKGCRHPSHRFQRGAGIKAGAATASGLRRRHDTRSQRAFLISAAASSSSNTLPVQRRASATSTASIGASR